MASTRQKGTAGFTALNHGNITNCYSSIKIKQKEHVSGFCFENEGTISKCASFGKVKAKDNYAGFCLKRKGTLEDSFWVNYGENQDALDKYEDAELSVNEEKTGKELLKYLNFDEKVWHVSDDDKKIALYSIREELPSDYEVVEIDSAEDLAELTQNVNDGISKSNIIYRLTSDINMKGKSWTPIGLDPGTPFEGTFDGNGYEISNFYINASKNAYAGFFGFIGEKGQVHNLSVDCIILGFGSYSAPLAASNDGLIANCTACARVDASRYSSGFAARNNGKIIRCSSFGKGTMPVIIPIWFLGSLLAAGLLATAGLFYYHNSQNAVEVFAPVIIDPNAKPIEKDDPAVPAPAPEDLSDSSACFIMNAEMEVGRDNYAGYMGLRCPYWSTRGFVATAIAKGSELSANGSSYTSDAVVYKSGLIKPGMGVNVVTLTSLPDGSSIPAGNYELIVQFDFYDTVTNERSSVNSTAPIDVVVS